MTRSSSGDADLLLAEAAAVPLSGWDFSRLAGRVVSDPLPWDYLALAGAAVGGAQRVLDIDTGGGEVLASLGVPRGSVALEPYPPNVPVARQRLLPYGIEVRARTGRRLPCESLEFDVVLNRHGALDPAEIARVLQPGGVLWTQQVGASNDAELNTAFGAAPPIGGLSTAAEGAELLRAAGLDVLRADEAWPQIRFLDVGAIVLQLRAVSWQVPGFDVARHRPELLEIDRIIRTDGAFTVTDHRLLFHAVRPL
ncbi:MAG TPA: ubiquinone biosynthesis protein [Microlunatus sp.]